MKHYNIPIFVPHRGCPFDCVFCNQKHITGSDKAVTGVDVEEMIATYLKTLPKDAAIEAAFFGGSFTGIPMAEQKKLLAAAHKFIAAGKIDGIRISTRPDYINPEICNQLAEFGVTTVELGVQSMDSDVLRLARRGHTAEDVKKAVAVLRQYPFSLGLQMMTGLPGDTPEKSVATAETLIALEPDFVRIYPTLVVEDTALAVMYKNGTYTPQTLEDAVALCKELLCLFQKADIPVIRVALQTTAEIAPDGAVIAGPFHSAFRELCESEIYWDLIKPELKQGVEMTFSVHPRELSKAVGNRRENIKRAEAEFGAKIRIVPDGAVPVGKIKRCEKEG